MKLLISAYACAPDRGSEHGSAWGWTTEANRLGHFLWVLVSPQNRQSIAAAVRRTPELQRINWVFPEVRFWPMKPGVEPKWERTYNLLWQKAAVPVAESLQAEIGFDFVHHLTWAGIRAPTCLGSLGVPLIIGPIGGGETSPAMLRNRLPVRGRLLESVRDFSSRTIEMNPYVRHGFQSASVIFARTEDTRNVLSAGLRSKTLVRMELGVQPEQIGAARAMRNSAPRLLFAGRLLYWKGVHIAIEAMASLVKKSPDIRLTIVGSGPEEKRLKADVNNRGLGQNVEFISWMKQEGLTQLYEAHDMLVFPSLHDSAGWVVLEALCRGLPVACLDLGGPKEIVTTDCGIIVNTKHASTSEVASCLSDQIHEVVGSRPKWERLSAGAIARAQEFILSDQVAELYEVASRFPQSGLGMHADKKYLAAPVQSKLPLEIV